MHSTRIVVFRPSSPSPVPESGGSDSTRRSSSCTSRVCRVEIRCHAVSTRITDPPMISHAANVA